MIRLAGGSTGAALAVALAPYLVWALPLAVVAVGCLAALPRFAWARGGEGLEWVVAVLVNAAVALLTLTPVVVPPRSGAGSDGAAGPGGDGGLVK